LIQLYNHVKTIKNIGYTKNIIVK